MLRASILGFVCLALTPVCLLAQSNDVFDTIVFGSCAREREPQPIWSEIIAQQPDVFLFIGDNQYADLWMKDGRMVMEPIPNIERLREAYAMLAAQPGYRRMQRTAPIMATWDDHDYGENDAGREFYLRRESQKEFIDFYNFRRNHPIHQQEGIYHSRIFGEPRRRVQIIMLDTRYHRDAIDRKPERVPGLGPYTPTADTGKTILGETQWAWLEEQLQQPADLRIIASSIQVVSYEHGFETWGNFPHERQRLYDLIDETDASGVLIVSGDRHLMEISRDTETTPYPIWDFTSSGMTQRPSVVNDPNRFRVGPVTRETNFGVIRIDWHDDPEQTQVHLVALGDQSQVLTRQTLFLSDLQE
ncbi:alkaline phosphatase D family protein [Mucisphaera sp.]|uniref:alkaline phosphatase D family protein n=1 Tax=Mucisphaera sp. TaxID=2913024 RepID=UPI003D0F4860